MAATAPPYPEAMTPESSEGRERMARLEVQVDANKRQIETLGSLPLAVERVQWRLDELAESLKKAEIARLDDSRELRRAFASDILVVTDGLKGCSSKINEVADAQRKWQEAENARRAEEAKTVRVERTQDIVSRRTLYGVLGAAALAALAAIVAPILNAIFG